MTEQHPLLSGLKRKGDYYLVDEKGDLYDRELLEAGVALIDKRAKGAFTVADAKELFTLLVDADKITVNEMRTLDYLKTNFKFTPAALKNIEGRVAAWEAEHGPAVEDDAVEVDEAGAAENAPEPKPATEVVPKPAAEAVTKPKAKAKPKAKPQKQPAAKKAEEKTTPAEPVEVSSEPAEVPATPAEPAEVAEAPGEVVETPEIAQPIAPTPPGNPMRAIFIDKVVANIGVGEGGEKLLKAENVLRKLTGAKPVRTISRTTNRDLGIRLGAPVGCKVTLRGPAAAKLLKEALWVRENRVFDYSISQTGVLSFGLPDYTGFPDQKYDPDIGIFGLDLSVVLKRPGVRITRRRARRAKVGNRQKVSRKQAKAYLIDRFQVEVVE